MQTDVFGVGCGIEMLKKGIGTDSYALNFIYQNFSL
jgi:hypothetical protein